MKAWKVLLILVFVLALTACNIPTPAVTTPTGGSDPQQPAATQTPQAGAATDEQIVLKMIDAIQTRDFSSLRATMSPRFSIVTWNTSLIEVTSEEAIARLQSQEMAEGSAPVVRRESDMPALLGGADPLAQWGPVAQPIRAMHVTGLGSDQSREAVIVVARDAATGTLYFHGLMVPETGQFSTSGKPLDPMQALSEHLALALQNRDFATMRGLMHDRFAIATWNSGLEVISSDDALARMQGAQLAQGSQPSVRWDTDMSILLLGVDPLSFWGPVDQTVRAMHVVGLGSDTKQEAVMVIGRDPSSGDFYWHGMLLPESGHFYSLSPDAVPTNVQYVRAREDVSMRAGPGTNYDTEGLVFAGQTMKVMGRSADQNWWHIVCEQDPTGYCWVTADPALTEPASAP